MKEENININSEIKAEIKGYISKSSEEQFKKDVQKIERYLPLSQDVKYIIINLYIQLGKPDRCDNNVLEYRHKNDMWICLQPKIKNYICFKSKENCGNYINEELNKDDLYMVCPVENGKIIV